MSSTRSRRRKKNGSPPAKRCNPHEDLGPTNIKFDILGTAGKFWPEKHEGRHRDYSPLVQDAAVGTMVGGTMFDGMSKIRRGQIGSLPASREADAHTRMEPVSLNLSRLRWHL